MDAHGGTSEDSSGSCEDEDLYGDEVDKPLFHDHFVDKSSELLHFYRQRVRTFENERNDIDQRLDEINASTEQLHKAEWDLRIRTDEVAELQRALSDSHAFLHDERQQVLRLKASPPPTDPPHAPLPCAA